MNIALVYLLAAAIALVVAAPVALLAPIFFAVSLPMADLADDYTAPSTVAAEVLSPRTIETAAPFVAVYAARGESRPTVHAWSTCSTVPVVYPLSRTGRALKGAALKAATAKAGRKACTSHACPVTRSVSSQCVMVRK